MKIGVYSGSFNPIHRGHVALCDYLVTEGFVDEVWLIRSPLNPLKASAAQTLAPDAERQQMLQLAIEGHSGLRVCSIEDQLPRPNYSINTLQALQAQCPNDEIHLIVGADNWLIFDRWRSFDVILREFHLIVYPRPGYTDPAQAPISDRLDTQHVRFATEAPQFDISSTEIRAAIAQGVRPPLIDERVFAHIVAKKLYL